MKTIAMSLLFLAGSLVSTLAADYHLIQRELIGAKSADKGLHTVYVLVHPDQTPPWVFQKFDSQILEATLSTLPRGSAVHYEDGHWMTPVAPAKFETLKAACQKKGVSLVVDARVRL